jgi:hypothetical protein
VEAFSGALVRPQILHFHPPFCPACVLYSRLQGGGKRPNKWVRRSRIALYLGSSPHHARLVALVLSPTTGYVSPQFHLKYDDFFETVREFNALPESKWQQLACFVTATGELLKEPVCTKATQSQSRATAHPRGISQEDPFGFDFVDLGETEEGSTTQDREPDAAPPIPEEQSPPEKPPDPERHRHPDATRCSNRQPNPTQRLIETAYAVLDETDAVED